MQLLMHARTQIMPKEWAEITCEVPAAMVDTLADYLIEISSTGVSIDNLVLDTFSLESVDEASVKHVKAYFPYDDSIGMRLRDIEAFLIENGQAFSGFVFRSPSVTSIQEQDWSTSWKDHFKPQRIGKRLVVKPTWEVFQGSDGDVILELDPGMAFGTGTHPTTRLCLSILEGILADREREGNRVFSVLDVGVGSGILGIAAAHLGVPLVEAIDIDPEAVRVARENCELNGVSGRVTVSETPLGMIRKSFDIVLANILAEDLVRMSSDLVERTNPNGFLILSGILNEKEALIVEGYASRAVTLVEIARDEDWCCFVYRRNR
jgi:ribosomal protein L11 methyltransferase